MTAFNRLSDPRRPSGFVPRESESLSFRQDKKNTTRCSFLFLSMGFERSGSELHPLTGCQSRDDQAASCRENPNPYLSAIVSNEY